MSKLLLQNHGLAASRIDGLRTAVANDDGVTASELRKRVRVWECHVEKMLDMVKTADSPEMRAWCVREIGEAIIEVGNHLIPALEAMDAKV